MFRGILWRRKESTSVIVNQRFSICNLLQAKKFSDASNVQSLRTAITQRLSNTIIIMFPVTGTSVEATGETEDPRWNAYSARKTNRSSSPRSWPSSSLEHAARPSNGKLPETTPSSVDRSSPGTRLDLDFLETAAERSEEDEDGRKVQPSGGSEIEDARVALHNPSISPDRSYETSQTDPSNRISIESSSRQSSTIGYRLGGTSTPRRFHDVSKLYWIFLASTYRSSENLVTLNISRVMTRNVSATVKLKEKIIWNFRRNVGQLT